VPSSIWLFAAKNQNAYLWKTESGRAELQERQSRYHSPVSVFPEAEAVQKHVQSDE
jgi:hypothetical protein